MTFDALPAAQAVLLPAAEVLRRVESDTGGLTGEEAARRLRAVGANVLRSHRAQRLVVLARQLRSPLLLLLLVTATVSFFVGERSDALIIGTILLASVGLGFVNEYRAEVAAEALHSQLRHRTMVRRDGAWVSLDVTELVPGDVLRLDLGGIVPADVRLLEVSDLECDESVLTGESFGAEKTIDAAPGGAATEVPSSVAFMGTVVRAGSAVGVVVATGGQTEFGRIALGLGTRHPETEFQAGLRQFSGLLVRVAAVLSTSILVVNVALGRSFIQALLFSLAITVGITPQLLPAIVTTSLATGSRRLARQQVLVKRLVCIEDLGDIAVLFTDKTGTLTEGRVGFASALDPKGAPCADVLTLGLMCNEATVEHDVAVGGNPLDVALWEAPGISALPLAEYHRVATVPFDHERRLVSVLLDRPDGTRLFVTKGAPENVLERCPHVPSEARAVLDAAFAAGQRVVAVATRPADGLERISAADEHDLELAGFLVFVDPPKQSTAAALPRLGRLGISVKVVTGDNGRVAEKLCTDLGLPVTASVTGAQLGGLDDDELERVAHEATIFARVSPDQKARIIQAHRRSGADVAFLGDGVNDAVALHAADVGISVDTATDVAKDAADIILLEKDLGVLADGVVEGRRTFANTIKYVLMGTSSNFGNMFSAGTGSTFLGFLPMLPSQILLNNLLYDSSQMTIPTDHVDEELIEQPSHWDLHMIRRFMLTFGPLSSIFDFFTFGLMLGAFDAGPRLFHSGWFVESLATQTLVIVVIRTRRVPFFRSRPSWPLLGASIGAVAVAAVLPFTAIASTLGFTNLPIDFFLALVVMVIAYLTLVEFAKRRFFRAARPPRRRRAPSRARRIHRRAAHWSHADLVPPPVA